MFAHDTHVESDLRKRVEVEAETAVFRMYVDGTSYDYRERTKWVEKEMIYSLLLSAVATVNISTYETEEEAKKCVQSIADVTELIAKRMLPRLNGYDSIYLPIKSMCRELFGIDAF